MRRQATPRNARPPQQLGLAVFNASCGLESGGIAPVMMARWQNDDDRGRRHPTMAVDVEPHLAR
jgi:hypothetical protein